MQRATALAGDILALIDSRHLARSRLAGHSMGAMAAALCAADHRNRVYRLVLIDLPPDVPDTGFAAHDLPAALAALGTASQADPEPAVGVTGRTRRGRSTPVVATVSPITQVVPEFVEEPARRGRDGLGVDLGGVQQLGR